MRETDCFFTREHDWRRIPFWHVNRWADHWGWRCRGCGVVRDESPTVWGVRAFFAWRLVWAALAIFGGVDIVVRLIGH